MQQVATELAAKAAGPYSQAIVHGGLAYVSGCIGVCPEKMALVEGGVLAQVSMAFANMEAVLKASGSSLSNVIKTTVYMTKMSDFAEVNALYAEKFNGHKPARSCLAAAELPKGALFEIDCIAVVNDSSPAASK
eukprot:TRINITY_DN3218_c0_g1_i1.p1 TRINITY_DN3218_c0_g1~~TRINITY_DN3218_c0_g1_i1.p1  ORF type:complete len:148 (+),score=33.74 TRINITY_DN3218_c0_g1_i1:43-444(+)